MPTVIARHRSFDSLVVTLHYPSLTPPDAGQHPDGNALMMTAFPALNPDKKRHRVFPPGVYLCCSNIRDANGQALAYVYYEDEPGRRMATHRLTRDEARRIALNIAKLPDLLKNRRRTNELGSGIEPKRRIVGEAHAVSLLLFRSGTRWLVLPLFSTCSRMASKGISSPLCLLSADARGLAELSRSSRACRF